MTFYERLISETTDERDAFLEIPLIQRTIRSGASRSLYLEFLSEAYHHVKHTVSLLALAVSRTTDERYQAALIEYIGEEHGHEKWVLEDITALGGNAEDVRNGKPGISCQVMVGYAYYAIERVSPYALLGSVHVLEGMSVLLADYVAEAMKQSLGLDNDRGLSYLKSHGSLDSEHITLFRSLVDGFEEHRTQQIIIENARIFYRLYGNIFQDLGACREYSDAA
ncbi:TenA family transcriptional regulator [Beijerinckia indica]|uniref:Heme oxygenase family n=1 Tax=Beijerinckia indica subsp. indica (strain ATCC 9039 / DSM 1715 / NCIMB 8712) TaxID=395963 RepID=B2IIW9_BEII9|nr:iron-containing redox enzyme family protein [Beijerinckia indica]ACB96181.1 heme oxygenase family [Beijerinckia indica subsp. indica ATCC 9039]